MADDAELPGDADERRAARRVEIIAELSAAHRARVPHMPEADFQAMIERMAEHQLIYEEYGGQ